MSRFILLGTVGWSICVQALHAQEFEVFLDRATDLAAQQAVEMGFLESVGNTDLINFDDRQVGPIGGNEWASHGVVFRQPGGAGLRLVAAAGAQQPYSRPNALWPVPQPGRDEEMDIVLTLPRNAVAFWLVDSELQSGDDSIEVFGLDSAAGRERSLSRFAMPVAGARGRAGFFFVGIWSEIPVTRIRIDESVGDNENVGLDNVHLGGVGMQLQCKNLAAESVRAPFSTAIGEALQVHWTIANHGALPGPAHWFDTLYFSTDESWSQDDVPVLRVPHDDVILGGGSATYQATLEVPTMSEGRYRVLVLPVLGRLGASDPLDVTWGARELIPGGAALASRLGADRREAYFKVVLDGDQDIEIAVDASGSEGVNDVYVARGRLPSRTDFDHRTEKGNAADRKLYWGRTKPGDHYILVSSAALPSSGSTEFSIAVKYVPLRIQSVTPDVSGNSQWSVVSPVIKGTKFRRTSKVVLVQPGQDDIPGRDVTLKGTTSLTARFDLRGARAGQWSIVVANADGETASIPFTILESGIPGFSASIKAPEVLGWHRRGTLWVEYANTGTAPMPVPLLRLHASQNAFLTIDPEMAGPGLRARERPPALRDRVQFLATGEEGDPGVLNPGQSGRVPVYWRGLQMPLAPSASSVSLELGLLGADDPTPIDWEAVEQEIKPESIDPSEWDFLFAEFKDRLDGTWGGYVRMLAENARLRARCGLFTYNATELYNDELQEISHGGNAAITGEIRFASSGDPAQGLRVIALAARGVTARTSVAREDGRFDIRFLPPDVYDLRVEGHALELPARVEVNEEHEARYVELGVVQGANIVGTVRTLDGGSAISGAHVTLKSSTGELRGADTDDSGAYVVTGLGQGTWLLWAEAPKHITSDAVSVAAVAGTTEAAHIVLARGGSVAGSVRDNAGWPIEGAHVLLSGENDAYFACTDAQGLFTMDGLHGGAYVVEARAKDHVTERMVDCSVEEGQNHGGVDFLLGRACVLEGTVLDASSAQAISSARVTLRGNSGELFSASSSADGRFMVAGVRPGVYVLEVDAPGHASSIRRTEIIEEKATSEIRLEAGGTIRGHVASAGEAAPVVGTPVLCLRGGVVVGMGITDSQGAYGFEDLPEGRHTVSVLHEQWGFPPAEVSVLQGSAVVADFAPAPGSLRGIVRTAAAGLPVEGARVVAFRGGSNGDWLKVLSCATDATGAFRFGHLEASTFWVTVAKDGFGRGACWTSVSSSAATVQDFALGGGTELRGLVTETGTGRGIPNATVWIKDARAPGMDPGQTALTDEAGAYRIANVSPGTYAFGVAAEGHVPHTREAVIAALPTVNLDAALALGGARIRGRLVCAESGYPVGMEPVLLGGQAQSTIVETDAEGYFAFANLPTGRFTLRALNAPESEVATVEIHTLSDDLSRDLMIALAPRIHVTQQREPARALKAEASDDEFPEPSGVPSECNSCMSFLLASDKFLDCVRKRGAYDGVLDTMGDLFARERELKRKYNALVGLSDSIWYWEDRIAGLWDNCMMSTLSILAPPIGWGQLAYCILFSPEICDAPGRCRINVCVDELLSVVSPFGAAAVAVKSCLELNRARDRRDQLLDSYRKQLDAYEELLDEYEVDLEMLEEEIASARWWCDPEWEPEHSNPHDSIDEELVGSRDPNAKIGPRGFGPDGFIAEPGWMHYTIYFENEAAATAAAMEVRVVDDLGPQFDWATVELLDVGFGDFNFFLPAGATCWAQRIQVPRWTRTAELGWHTESSPLCLDMKAGFDLETGRISWEFLAFDPETGTWPEDAYSGFLPPNVPEATDGEEEDRIGKGEGYVSFRVKLAEGLPDGTRILNFARNYFDLNDPIATPVARHTLDLQPPSSAVDALPAMVKEPDFMVTWHGDDAGGSGIAEYWIYAREDEGTYSLWLRTSEDSAAFDRGRPGHRYSFYSVAVDSVGRLESAPDAPDAETFVDLGETEFVRGDANADGLLNITDPIYALSFLFLGGTALPCTKAGDANDDGVLNISDPVRVLGHLFLGTGELPPPFGACGTDTVPDTLSCASYSPCGKTGGQ